jgi:hypothetical protein
MYWLNGEAHGLNVEDFNPTQIFVENNSVYVLSTGDSFAGYWKDGVLVPVDHPSSYSTLGKTYAMFVRGKDVYITGKLRDDRDAEYSTVYWKNGELTVLANTKDTKKPGGVPIKTTEPSGIYVKGNDVYISGFERNNGIYTPKHWKNDEEVLLDTGKHESGKTTGIFIDGKDVYICGYGWTGIEGIDNTTAMYWKNGALVEITDGTYNATLEGICVSEGIVYVVGNEECGEKFVSPYGSVYYANVPKYWKNGEEVVLQDGVSANSIFVVGTDVYVAGSDRNEHTNGIAKYWKNGVAVELTDGKVNYGGYGIYVVRK